MEKATIFLQGAEYSISNGFYWQLHVYSMKQFKPLFIWKLTPCMQAPTLPSSLYTTNCSQGILHCTVGDSSNKKNVLALMSLGVQNQWKMKILFIW